MKAGEKLAGRYRLLKRLGQGGMGAIWEVHNEAVERPFAIKVLHPHVARDPILVQRFLEEAKAAGRIRHAGVIEVVDAGRLEEERGGGPYMVMERLEGKALDAVVAEGKLDVKRACCIVRDAARAVAAAHAEGVVHRDLKPSNLFLHHTSPDAEAVVKVLDFGISKQGGRGEELGLTETGMVVGTPAYMAPEQTKGTAADARSDVWALGVVLYECLGGDKPFRGTNPLALALSIREDDPLPLHGIPPAVAAVVTKCLAKDPASRFQSATELAAALEETLVPEPTPAPSPAPEPASAPAPSAAPAPAPAPPPPALKRGWLYAALLAGVALALLIGLRKHEPSAAPLVDGLAVPPPPVEVATVAQTGATDDAGASAASSASANPGSKIFRRKSGRPTRVNTPGAATVTVPEGDPLRKPGF